ncbi:securin isoform X2 [Hemicordylus capensis]|nr:securin isoform X2 [Hemicordylus capensis]XP_053152512.1 securin isoform X2 [Hemicordylus capensis]XP_053152513.1 securin isoform X2 [Hemicordylus capensis]XP_053152515.1 securin isoform X2 [Hemicordylus capensis]XP_053152516.1 securin isoform X2 [Hemicordylus capensis]XP_053152517.1 securin isoform X2 [Hemicordylus capensis]
MATHIFVDKENGEIGPAVKGRLRLLSAPSKVFVERPCPKTPLVGRTANVNSATSTSVRKALGNVNRTLPAKNLIPKGKRSFSTKKVIENTNKAEGCSMVTEDYPEKENFFPYNPLEFENFEVPEEHRLSHLSLMGVPLMTFENASDRFASTIPAPVKPPSLSWGYDALQSTKDYLAALDEITIDLPPPL